MLGKSLKTIKKEKNEFPPIPADVYQVELFDITAKEVPTYDTKNKPDSEKEYESVLDFQFTLLNGTDKDMSSLRGRNIWRNFVPNYFYEGKNGKNIAYQIVEAFLGREMTLEEEFEWNGENWNSLIGKQCRIVIENTVKDKKTWSNIKSLLPAKEELPSLTFEEREKAVVKKKEGEQSIIEQEEIAPMPDEEINIDEVI